MLPCYFPMEEGKQQLFCSLLGGIGLGKYHEEGEIHEFKTFVDDSLLRKEQKEQVRQIWMQTMEEISAELNRRLKRDGTKN